MTLPKLSKFRPYVTPHYLVVYHYFDNGTSMVVVIDRDMGNKLAGYAISQEPEIRPSALLSKAVVNMVERRLWRLGRDAGLHSENRC